MCSNQPNQYPDRSSQPAHFESLEERRVFSAFDPLDGAVAFNANEQLVAITVEDPSVGPVAQWQNAGGWWAEMMSPAGQGGRVTGEPEAWQDPYDRLVYAALPTVEGLQVYRELDPSTAGWVSWNVSASIPGSTAPVGDIVSLVTDSLVHVAGFDTSGDLVVYMQTGGVTSGNEWAWTYRNLTDEIEARGGHMPSLRADSLISYVPSWNSLHLAALDEHGEIWSVWSGAGSDQWNLDNLSEITGAAPFAGGLSSYLPSGWDGLNLTGVDDDGELFAVWWVPEFGGNWEKTNFTELFGGAPLEADSVVAYATEWDGLNIAARDQNQSLVQYWWASGMGAWKLADLSGAVGGSPGRSGFDVATSPSGVALLSRDFEGRPVSYNFNVSSWWSQSTIAWESVASTPVLTHDPVNELQSLILTDVVTGDRYEVITGERFGPAPGFVPRPTSWSTGEPYVPLDEMIVGIEPWMRGQPSDRLGIEPWTTGGANGFDWSAPTNGSVLQMWESMMRELGLNPNDFPEIQNLYREWDAFLAGDLGDLNAWTDLSSDFGDIFGDPFDSSAPSSPGATSFLDVPDFRPQLNSGTIDVSRFERREPAQTPSYSTGRIANGNGYLNVSPHLGSKI